MARTGSALIVCIVALASASAVAAEPEFYMTVDRNKVGTEDTFRLDIVVGNAPDGSSIAFPAANEFEVLSRSESTQMSYSVGTGGAGVITQLRRYTLTLRANRAGMITIPPATLKTGSRTYKTESVNVEVVKGRTRTERPRQAQNPFGFPPGFPQMQDPFEDEPAAELDIDVPRSDSDFFLRESLDKTEVFVGEQVMLSVVIYSQIDLASVDTVSMPKFEGFWTQDIQSANQLTPERKVIDGVPYRSYLLRQKAMFAMKAGEMTIEAAEADINAGNIFSGRRAHRKSNTLKLKVKPLPNNASAQNVGHWRLAMQATQTDVTLGDPVQVKVQIDGRGNLQSVQVPTLQVPAGLKKFDPQISDKPTVSKNGQVGGTRIIEYVMVPQQTGTFTLPGLTLQYFDPESKHFEESRTDPIIVTVRPAAGGAAAVAPPPDSPATADAPVKNQLVAGGVRQLRATANFTPVSPPLWSRGFFVPLAVTPVVLSVLLLAVGLARSALGKTSPEALKRAQAKAARKRLAAAEKLLGSASTAAFYEEVERALRSFLEAKLNVPLSGLTREALDAQMTKHEVPARERARVLAVFETCDLGRYAPGMGEASARNRALDDAAAAMEAWA